MRTIRRGYLPEYEKTFRAQAIDTLREAVTDALFLLNRGHSLKRATTIAMEHYQLTDHQRLAISRGIASNDEIARRAKTNSQEKTAMAQRCYLMALTPSYSWNPWSQGPQYSDAWMMPYAT